MTKAKTGCLLLGILCMASFAVAQDTAWEKYMKAGTEALERGQYVEAEKQFKAAVKEAEKFGAQDSSLGISLLALVAVYKAEGRDAEVEPLLKRSLASLEKAWGQEHPNVSSILNGPGGPLPRPGQVRRSRAARPAGAGDS